jgi:hypothetical protein
VIENLEKQQDAVKKNMLFLIERRAENLVKKVKEELSSLQEEMLPREISAQKRQDIQNVIRRARVEVKKDAVPGAYEIRNGTFKDSEANLSILEDQDVKMGHVEPRTQASIRADLTYELRDLVMRGASEMEAYEAHAEETGKIYKQMLQRRKGRAGHSTFPSGPSSALPPRSILINRNGERPADREPTRKVATFNV